jgi:hypothetical protein
LKRLKNKVKIKPVIACCYRQIFLIEGMSMKRVQIVRLMAAMAVGTTLASVTFAVTNVKNGQFSVSATCVGSDDVEYQIADSSGKVKSFVTVDDFISQAAKAGVINGNTTDVTFDFSNVVALEPAVYAGDLTKRAQTQLTSIAKNKAKAEETVVSLNTQLALFGANLTAGEAAQKAEKTAQRDAVVELVTWYGVEAARIRAILGMP